MDLNVYSFYIVYVEKVLWGIFALTFIAYYALRFRHYNVINRIQKRNRQQREEALPPFVPLSVVIVCHNQANDLRANLPSILEQDYPLFEVILVNNASTDDTEDVIKQMEAQYKNLRHTFTPDSSRYISYKKLSVTLGFRSAKYDWVVLTQPDCRPSGEFWLQRMASHFKENTDIVLGYSNYPTDEDGLLISRASFERLLKQLFYFNAAFPNKRAVGGDGCNMAVRKEIFIQKKAYATNLNLTCGEDELLIDSLASKGNTAVECSQESIIRQHTMVSEKIWSTEQYSRLETLRYLRVRGKWLHKVWGLSTCSHYLFLLSGIASVVIAAMFTFNYIAIGVIAFLMILNGIVNQIIFRRITRLLDERSCFFSLMWYELGLPFSTLIKRMQARRHRQDFRKKL